MQCDSQYAGPGRRMFLKVIVVLSNFVLATDLDIRDLLYYTNPAIERKICLLGGGKKGTIFKDHTL